MHPADCVGEVAAGLGKVAAGLGEVDAGVPAGIANFGMLPSRAGTLWI